MYNIKYTCNQNNTLRLVEPYVFNGHTIPINYISDGLTIPVVFRLWVNKFSPKYLPCAVMHDMLTDMAYEAFKAGDKQLASKLFKEADSTFKMMLTIADGGNLSYRAKIMHKTVVLYHKFKYKV